MARIKWPLKNAIEVGDKIGNGGKLNIFYARLTKLIEKAAIRYGLKIPTYSGSMTSGGNITVTSLPAYYLVWLENPMANNQSSRLFFKGKMAIHLISEEFGGDENKSRQYLYALDEAINEILTRHKDYLGVGNLTKDTMKMEKVVKLSNGNRVTMLKLQRDYTILGA